MSITIQINPSLEKRLRQKANLEGVALDDLIEQVLENWSESVPPGESDSKKHKETTLLQQINSTGFSDDFWLKYNALIHKRQSETISDEELAQLIKMSDQLEKANVRRLKYIIELSKIRNIPVRDLMSQLGIPLGGHA